MHLFALTLRRWPSFCLFASLIGAPVAAAPESLLPYSKPNLNPSGIESAFIASQGDYYGYLAGFAYESREYSERYSRKTVWVHDASAGLGMGLGSSKDSVALQLGYNLNSLRGLDDGGTLDLKVARDLIQNESLRIALGGGVLGVYTYGRDTQNSSTPFAVATMALPVRVDGQRRTVQFNLGYGGGKFRDNESPGFLEQGIFASAGIEFDENVGVSVGWSGRGVNATLSVTPVRGIPLSVGASLNNLTNHDQLGRAAVLSLAWGGTFQTASF